MRASRYLYICVSIACVRACFSKFFVSLFTFFLCSSVFHAHFFERALFVTFVKRVSKFSDVRFLCGLIASLRFCHGPLVLTRRIWFLVNHSSPMQPFDFIASSVVDEIGRLSVDRSIPVALGLLTTENVEQALERSGGRHGNKGAEAAETAIEMANLARRLS